MAMLSTRTYMDKLISHALSLGHLSSVNEVDIASNPGNSDLIGILYFRGARPIGAGSGLNSTSVVVEFTMRLVRSVNTDPLGQIDPQMVDAMDTLMNAYSGDFTLDGAISYVDLLGEHGQALDADSGFLKITEDLTYRIIDITIPCVIHDVWIQEA